MAKLKENVLSMSGGKRRAQPWPDDPRDIPAFTITEVARSLRMSPDRLSDWLKPREEYGRIRKTG